MSGDGPLDLRVQRAEEICAPGFQDSKAEENRARGSEEECCWVCCLICSIFSHSALKMVNEQLFRMWRIRCKPYVYAELYKVQKVQKKLNWTDFKLKFKVPFFPLAHKGEGGELWTWVESQIIGISSELFELDTAMSLCYWKPSYNLPFSML